MLLAVAGIGLLLFFSFLATLVSGFSGELLLAFSIPYMIALCLAVFIFTVPVNNRSR
jgi:hypothetical protein